MFTLTAEQAQQIEEALDNVINDWVAPDDFPFEDGEMPALDGARNALATIRAARAQEQAEHEPVAWALSHSLGIEFGSKYPMRESKEVAEQMAREHMGNVVVTPLYAAPVRTKDLK